VKSLNRRLATCPKPWAPLLPIQAALPLSFIGGELVYAQDILRAGCAPVHRCKAGHDPPIGGINMGDLILGWDRVNYSQIRAHSSAAGLCVVQARHRQEHMLNMYKLSH